MRSNYQKLNLKTAVLAACILLLGVSAALAQPQQVNLTAAPAMVALPDGKIVPMWGYFCGSTTSSTATCRSLNPAALPISGTLSAWAPNTAYALNQLIVDSNGNVEEVTTAGTSGASVPTWVTTIGGVTSDGTVSWTLQGASNAVTTWSPVVITVPTGQDLQINLTNSLSFPTTGAPNNVPTSLVIVGQLGGGLGNSATSTVSPDHTNAQEVTWPIAAPGTPAGTPPAQGNRVQSFSTEVVVGTPASLCWGASCSTPTPALKPGTYLIESGTHPSIQGPMGLYGMLVVTAPPTQSGGTETAAGTAYPGVSYDAEVPVLFSEIDPVQNNSVQAAVTTAGFSETMVWSGQPGGCGNPTSTTYHLCYPPAVNYIPLYYLINGVGFDKTHSSNSLFVSNPASTSSTATSVLVRMVNAGLRMHVPAIVGSQTGSPAVPGFGLIAEDGNPLPGVTRVQNEVFMAAGKTYDVKINVPASTATALPIYDRELSLSGNGTAHDAGMLAYLRINGAALPAATEMMPAAAVADNYASLVAGQTLTVSDPAKGVIANDTNVYGVKVVGTAPAGLTLNTNGTFTYTGGPTTFTYCGNGTTSGAACAMVTLGNATPEAGTGVIVADDAYPATATALSIAPPGVLVNDKDTAGYPLTVDTTTVTPSTGLTLTVDPTGGFHASVTTAGTYTFTYRAKNSQGTQSASGGTGNNGIATVTLTFPAPSGLNVTVLDGTDRTTKISDYRWVIEEDRTFYIDPKCTTNPPPAGCPTAGAGIVPTFGTNFHTSYMPVIATGCTGPLSCESGQTLQGAATVCDVGNGGCRPGAQQAVLMPSAVHLDPTKRYYISVLPGDAANPFEATNLSGSCKTFTNLAGTTGSTCGHGMGGAPILFPAQNTAVTIFSQPTPFPPSKLSVFVFEDDFPLNGEQDGGGGIDVLSPNEPGLGGFNITLFDDAGGTGDATGQMTYDMFNQPLDNALSGTMDPATGMDACPVSAGALTTPSGASPTGITGTIVTCPTYESDGATLSPLAGQAVIANLMPGRYGVVATPGADHIARGEEWLQTNTLDGQKAHDSFLRIGEPSFFQEYGPAGFHVSIGFANPQIINARKAGVCGGVDPNITGTNCTNGVTAVVTTERMSRTPDERLYGSGDNSSFSFTQCYVSFGDADGEDFAFTKCDANGRFTLSGLPDGDWRITVFDQWNDMLVDGLSTPVRLSGGKVLDLGQLAMNQWQANIYTKTFIDTNSNGVQDDPATEPGLALVATNNRFRDGSYSNFNNTDLMGNAGFNEIFPLFSWYVIESDTTRYKTTGIHVVYDAGGPADGSPDCGASGTAPCGGSNIGAMMANTAEQVSVPPALRVPGARYCNSADCPSGDTGTAGALSTGRVDPPFWFGTEGWQGFSGQNQFVEFAKKPFVAATATTPAENGGIHGEVIYASTRPFDDPGLLIHTSWTPDVPGVTVNLYQEGVAADGVTPTLKLVDTTKTSSWDDWAQGFYSNTLGTPGFNKPYMSCPGQFLAPTSTTPGDLFFFSLFNQPNWLDQYNHGGVAAHTIPNNSQFKCYDGMHNWNQVQPAPFDGMYAFPSVTSLDPNTGRPLTTNCTVCVPNPSSSNSTSPDYDPYRAGTPMLPAGKYVVEMIVPPGYELVKEEDKNILIGDNYIAPVTQEFAGLGSAIYILPDQAEISSNPGACDPNSNPTACNFQQQTQSLGRTTLPSHEGDTGSVETFWPCVGQLRMVPDYISLYPQSHEVAPFAGAMRNLCDRKEVQLDDQTSALAKFWIFTSAHVAAHYTGVITDDYTSEFDPFSPQFGEKFSPPDLPISVKDWTGTEISRTYADHWGTYDGLTYSTWEVNPPNPTGYAPTMMITCMNDPGPIPGPNGTMVTDPLFNPEYSQFCYEIPFMPGQTQYMDTPVVPTSAFAGAGYNNPDCAYPGGTASAPGTPAIKEVDGDGVGPWVAGTSGHTTLTITALGDQAVPNNAYSGPSATTAPYNQKTVIRHYGFGTTKGSVTIGGFSIPSASITTWNDSTIVLTVPTINGNGNNIPLCSLQQQSQYGGPANASQNARCGELVITTSTGQQSIDTVTVTIGGKAPTHIAASASIQTAIDKARPGDLLIVDPTCTTTGATPTATACSATALHAGTPTQTASQGAHNELVVMWKPVRLQGVGAVSSIINANTHPAGKLNDWRTRIDCLMGLGVDGVPTSWKASCGSGWSDFTAKPNVPQDDRLPLEAAVGWTASLNGNLAELLQEPSLMGALEGAGITVLSKGVDFHGADPWSDGTEPGGMPPVTTLLQSGIPGSSNHCNDRTNPFPSNFMCNPSGIDGLTVTDSSQGGGGIFVHGWGHNIQIANNRVQNNAGTLSGGINIGQGEFPGAYLQGSATNAAPGSCQTRSFSGRANSILPYCHNINVNVHNNYVTDNSSTGDELFSATPAGAGGVSFCTGSDFYKFNNNWVCGNLSSGDGGGFGHMGFSYNGDIEHNAFLFNQSTNPTIPTNGGGLIIMGAPDVDPTCGAQTDQDCVPALGSVGPSDGTGPGLTINANLIMGNQAESGTGGGIALQNVNGSDVVSFPNGASVCSSASLANCGWNSVALTNNVITNNVAGWDGGGVSLLDALAVNFINNTVVSNDSTASSGILFNTIGGSLASQQQGSGCQTTSATASCPQVAGLVSLQNSATLTANLVAGTSCPTGHGVNSGTSTANCTKISVPLLYNDLFWQNRSFFIGVSGPAADTTNQQNQVALFNRTGTPAATQSATGACSTSDSYWDIGVRGDTGPTNHGLGTLAPVFSFVGTGGYAGTNSSNNPNVVHQYCNGSRVPPEYALVCPAGTGCSPSGWQVPPGISDATVPNPLFNLTPTATVDEGNNWVNISWGPLAITNPVTNAVLGNYALNTGSTAINYIPSSAGGASGAYTLAPSTDYFGNSRKNGFVDAGAIEFAGAGGGGGGATATVSPSPLNFGNWATGTTSNPMLVTVTNTGSVALAGGTYSTPGAPFARVTTGTFPAGAPNCGATLAVGASCTLKYTFAPTAAIAYNANVTVAFTGATVTGGAPLTLTGTGVITRGAVTISPNPLTITLPSGILNFTGTSTVTLTNSAASASSVAVTGVGVSGGSMLTYFFNVDTDNCTGTNLAPGQSCTVVVRFTNVLSARGTNRAGTISVTDTATGSPQSGGLIGFATP